MASPEQPADVVQQTPLQTEISAETERLLGCLCTPKDSTISNASRSGRWRGWGGTAGLSSNTATGQSVMSNVRPPAAGTSPRPHTPQPHTAAIMQVSTPGTPLSNQATAPGRQKGIADLGKVRWRSQDVITSCLSLA